MQVHYYEKVEELGRYPGVWLYCSTPVIEVTT
jgi:hypothetical protein